METEQSMEVGAKVIIYTMIMRGNAQTSYVGTIVSTSQMGLTIEGPAGKIFFPWSAIERVTY